MTDALRKELLLDLRSRQDDRLNASIDVEQAVLAACDQAGLQHVRDQGGLRAVAQVVLDTLDNCLPDESAAGESSKLSPAVPGTDDVARRKLRDTSLPSKDVVVQFCISLSSEILESQQLLPDNSEARFYF